jgi:ferrochelatase
MRYAVILLNLGCPDYLIFIKKFLFNLFSDRAIIDLPQPLRFFLAKLISITRVKKATKIYKSIGGKSPLLYITKAQAETLEKELSFFGNFKVFVAMRYYYPRLKDIRNEILAYDKIILLPLYPQFSSATTGSSFAEFDEIFPNKKAVKIYDYCDDDLFCFAHGRMIKNTIENYENKKNIRLLFSAHGLPQKLVDQGDKYVSQIEKTTKKTIEILSKSLGKIDFTICYQSKVGPLKWTSPSTTEEIFRCFVDNKIPVLVPISFVSEHSETLFELDIEYRQYAKSLGIADYLRVPALNCDGYFIKSLVEIIKKAL